MAALALAGLALLAACGRSSAAEQPRIEVTAREMSFAPAQVVATAGRPITIVFNNVGAGEHDWAVPQLAARDVRAARQDPGGMHQSRAGDDTTPAVHVAAMPGERGSLVFTPERSGRYTIVCTVPGHMDAGMMGMLTVTD